VWIIGADGSMPHGAPFAAIGPDANTTPAIGDVDGDGAAELVVVAADGSIYAWNGDGSEVVDGDENPATTGVFAQVGRSLRDAVPVLARLSALPGAPVDAVIVGAPADSNGMGEVFWAELPGDGLGLARLRSAEIPGDLTAPALVFDTAPPTMLVAAVAEGRTRTFTVRPDPLGEMPVVREIVRDRAELQNAVRSMIAGDLDADGTFEVIASDDHGRIEVYATGLPVAGGPGELTALRGLAGWPFALGLGVAHDIALADMDRDGRLEVLLSAFDGRLYALNFNGTPQLSFPEAMGGPDRLIPRLAPSPLAVDLAGDDLPELLFAPGDGRAFATGADGRLLDGWPLPGPAGKGALPIVADLDGDDRLDLVVPSEIGTSTRLIAYDLGVAEGPGSVWTGYRGGPGHRGLVTAPPLSPAARSFVEEVFVYPNPVDGDEATIHFSLGEEATVEVEILDATGRVVARPAASQSLPGRTDHEVRWDVRDAASGVYLLRLAVKGAGADVVETRPFAVTR
jgi:hypothetical protein